MDAYKGSPLDTNSEFQFSTCHLNLPLALDHDSSMPRAMLLWEDGELATSEVTYVDDVHVAARVKEGEFDHARTACK